MVVCILGAVGFDSKTLLRNLAIAECTTHLALVRFFLQHGLEVVKKLFVKLD